MALASQDLDRFDMIDQRGVECLAAATELGQQQRMCSKELLSSDESPIIEEKTQIIAETAPRDGSALGWLQVAGSFFLLFNSWGIINTFGVFQTYYGIAFANSESPSNVSWIGSTQSFLLLLVGVITGPLYDAGYFRALITTGSFLVIFGFMMTSLCSQYWQVMLAQAFCIGLGTGCLYIPSVAILPQYFASKTALAFGVASSGSSLGGVIYPMVFSQLQQKIGFAWSARVLGFISLATCALSMSVMRVRQKPKQTRVLVDFAAFREAPYSLFCAAMFFAYAGFFGPVFYVQTYAIDKKITSKELAFHLLSILNAASVPGRIIPGLLVARFGFSPVSVLLIAAVTSGILTLCWIAIHSSRAIIAFSVLYGLFSGSFIALASVVLARLTPDLKRLGTRMGMCSIICGFGSLCGTPVCGAILNATGNYLGVQLFSGIAAVLTSLLLLAIRFCETTEE